MPVNRDVQRYLGLATSVGTCSDAHRFARRKAPQPIAVDRFLLIAEKFGDPYPVLVFVLVLMSMALIPRNESAYDDEPLNQ